jgi:hypothetical protein
MSQTLLGIFIMLLVPPFEKGFDMCQSYLKAMRVAVLANGLRCLLEIIILSLSLERAKSSHGDVGYIAHLDMEITILL